MSKSHLAFTQLYINMEQVLWCAYVKPGGEDCSSAAGGYAFSSISMGRVIQPGQVSAEEPDEECPKA
jgi:hypothetical protein